MSANCKVLTRDQCIKCLFVNMLQIRFKRNFLNIFFMENEEIV